ncbi:cell-division protein [Bacillus sp. TS-2]|nr:cell-division protein [Bacillus sp. TS-2]
MKLRTLGRHFKEGTKNLGRNGWMTFASISAVTIMLFVVGVFLLLILNINHLATAVEDDVEIRVYIDLTADDDQQEELREEIEGLPNVNSVTFVDKDQGLNQLIDSLEDRGEVFESIREENPLNDVFVVQASNPQLTEQVANEISEFNFIDQIRYGQDFVERLFAVTNLARVVGVVLVIGMMFTAMFLISNTIKLTIVARKREIKIMKLVGATNGFIRWPFFVEGLFLGIIGSLIPVTAIGFGYHYFISNYGDRFENNFFSLLPVFPFVWQIGLLLLGIGALVGVWGSVMSVRKFLRV